MSELRRFADPTSDGWRAADHPGFISPQLFEPRTKSLTHLGRELAPIKTAGYLAHSIIRSLSRAVLTLPHLSITLFKFASISVVSNGVHGQDRVAV